MLTNLPITGLCVLFLLTSSAMAQEKPLPSVTPANPTHKPLSTPGLIFSTATGIITDSTDNLLSIRDVDIRGARRTRKSTVLRELSFRQGEGYPLADMPAKLEQSRRQLMNTNLFRTVVISLTRIGEGQVAATVELQEKWYFFPQPFVRLANGTFSQWNERGRQLDHLNYGIKLTQFNFSGRADKVHLHLADGYTKKIALQYQGFYFDKALKWSGSINLAHGKNREMNYATDNNKLLAVKNPDGYLFEFFQSSFDLVYRPAIKTRHQWSIGYHSNKIADTISKLNANFAAAQNNYNYPYVSYGVSFIDYDFNAYPTRGRAGDVSILKAGVNSSFNLWQLSVRGTNYWATGKKTYVSLRAGGTVKLPFKQPYVTQGFLGYGDAYLQGLENYIIDGVAGGYARATAAYQVVSSVLPLPRIKWLKNLNSVPFRIFAKVYGNTGYAYNPNKTEFRNGLNNRMLYSSGVGLDLVAFTDFVFKVEWSFNQLGQNAVFFHQ